MEFPSLAPGVRHAMLTHELLHIQRGDWPVVVAEELLRCALWFHPAIWWLLGRIQLTREQAVDREAIERTGQSQPYLDALLAIASRNLRPDLAPAPLFLKKRHLRQRVASIVTGVHMSKRKTIVSLIAVFCTLPLVVGVAAWRFPLTAAAQNVVDDPGVQVQTGGWTVLHRSGIVYPGEARQKGLSGEVAVTVATNDKGEVTDARAISGPEELRKPVLQSVLSWHFAASAASNFQVTVRFETSGAQATPPPPPPAGAKSVTVEKIEFVNVPAALQQRVLDAGVLHEGDVLSPDTFGAVSGKLQSIDSHLRMSGPLHGDKVLMRISLMQDRVTAQPPPPATPQSIRVGPAVQASNLIRQVKPEYPALARQARIQGTVYFSIIIGKDGHVQNMTLISGHPLLVQPAQDALQQWVYQPTLLNGEPVAVQTTVDITFTLSE